MVPAAASAWRLTRVRPRRAPGTGCCRALPQRPGQRPDDADERGGDEQARPHPRRAVEREPERRTDRERARRGDVVDAERLPPVLGRGGPRREHARGRRDQAIAQAHPQHQGDDGRRRLHEEQGEHARGQDDGAREHDGAEAEAIVPSPDQGPQEHRHDGGDREEQAHLGLAPAERDQVKRQDGVDEIDRRVDGRRDGETGDERAREHARPLASLHAGAS